MVFNHGEPFIEVGNNYKISLLLKFKYPFSLLWSPKVLGHCKCLKQVGFIIFILLCFNFICYIYDETINFLTYLFVINISHNYPNSEWLGRAGS